MTRRGHDFELAHEDVARPHRQRRRAGRWKRRLLVLLILVAVGVAALPWLVAKTPLGNLLIAAAMPGDDLTITFGDASLGWFSEPSLAQVEIRDAAGGLLLAVESIRVRRTPWALATNWRDLGEIEIKRPTVYLDVRPDGSNVEDAISRLATNTSSDAADQTAEDATAMPVQVAVRVIDGTILVNDAATGRQWRASGLDLQFDPGEAIGGLGQFAAAGQLETKSTSGGVVPAGRFAVTLAAAEGGRQQLQGQAEALSLAALRPWLQRLAAGIELDGVLSGQGTARWTSEPGRPRPRSDVDRRSGPGTARLADFATSGTLRIDQLDVTAPALLGDHVRLARIDLPWRITAQPQGVVIEQLELQTDVGQVAARGAIDPLTITSAASSSSSPFDLVGRGDVEVRGEADLARLAAMLPRALRIRDDTTITGGSIQLAVRSQPRDGGQSLTGMVRTAALAATSAGRPIRWDQPATVNFDVRREAGRTRLESLRCDSEFLRVDAAGTAEQLTAAAEFDFSRLANQLGQIVDLRGVELAGVGTAHVELSRAGGDRSAAIDVRGAKLTATDLLAAIGHWRIEEPRANFTGEGRWDASAGEVALQKAELVTSTVAVAAQDVRVQLAGGGPLRASGAGAFRADLARLAAWRLATTAAPAYRPQGMITGNVRFAQQSDRITGEVTVNGQHISLAEWTGASRGVLAPDRGGGPPGSLESGYQTIWQEPTLSVRGIVAYEPSVDRLSIERFDVQSSTLQAAVAGGIDNLTTAAEVDMAGTVNYDLAQVTQLLRPYLGSGIQLVGREVARFQVVAMQTQGPNVVVQNVGIADQSAIRNRQSAIHWSRRIRARLEAPWSSANVYGLPVGGGKIGVELGDGAVRIDPLAITVAGGQLTAAPSARLDPEPMELLLPQGPLLTNVNISPEVSEAMLKYVAPVLAGATQSEGKFSLALEGARVPLGEPKRADVAGQLAVHSVRVVPGPMAKEWIALAQQIEAIAKRRDPAALAQRPTMTLLSIHDQDVNFRLVDGRVYHQNLEFQIDDVRLRSEGSVGLDETLSLAVHVPIQDKWIEGDRLLVGLKGRSLVIPVSGTLTRPRMDQSAVASLSQQLLQGAAQQAVGNELNRALDKLFKPR